MMAEERLQIGAGFAITDKEESSFGVLGGKGQERLEEVAMAFVGV